MEMITYFILFPALMIWTYSLIASPWRSRSIGLIWYTSPIILTMYMLLQMPLQNQISPLQIHPIPCWLEAFERTSMIIEPGSMTDSRVFFIQGSAYPYHPHVEILLVPLQQSLISFVMKCQISLSLKKH